MPARSLVSRRPILNWKPPTEYSPVRPSSFRRAAQSRDSSSRHLLLVPQSYAVVCVEFVGENNSERKKEGRARCPASVVLNLLPGWLRLQLAPDQYVRHVVIHGSKLRDASEAHHRKSERAAKVRVYRNLADKLARNCELD